MVDGHELYVSASIGVSMYPQDGTNMENLIKNADVAMYHVKGQGKNNYQFYSDDMNTLYYQKLSLDTGIHRALENDEFSLVYQPQINLKTGDIVGVEALLRWHDPEHGDISPSEFIPFAEETGLIVTIGEWVLNTALSELKRWRDSGIPDIRMSVNMSARHLADDNIVKTITKILAKNNLPGSCLEIEITENAIMGDMDSVIHKLKDLSDRGVTIAIDDFGTGYSSLSYLHKLPIQTLKIDRAFLKESRFTNDDHTIVETIVAMGKGLNLNVIAEGIETQKQLEYLRELKCNEAQGFLFGKPLTADLVIQLLVQDPYTVRDANMMTANNHQTH